MLTALAAPPAARWRRTSARATCARGSPRCAASSRRRRASLRELATRLRPPAVEEHGLEDAIEEQAARLRREGRAGRRRRARPGADLPEVVQTVLFRVVQESLTNVARHSGAERASVVVSARARPAAAGGRGRRPRLRHRRPHRPPRPRGHPRAGRAARRAPAHRVVPRTPGPPWSWTSRSRERARPHPAGGRPRVLRAGLRLLLEREEGLEPVGEAGTAEDAIRALPRLHARRRGHRHRDAGDGRHRGRRAHPRARPRRRASCSCRCTTRLATCGGPSTRAPHGYLLKSAADEDLVRAVRAVAAGERYVHPSLGAALAAPRRGRPARRALGARAEGAAPARARPHQPGDRRAA